MSEENMEIVVVSYFPAFDQPGGIRIDPDVECMNELTDILKNTRNSSATACFWAVKDTGETLTIFVMDHAKEIASHLIVWSEDSPSDWFQIALLEKEPLYGMALMPNLKRSVARFKAQCILKYGKSIPDNSRFNILFKPLSFISKPNHMFSQVKNNIGDKILLALCDPPLQNIQEENLNFLGEFDVVREGNITAWLDQELDETLKEKGYADNRM